LQSPSRERRNLVSLWRASSAVFVFAATGSASVRRHLRQECTQGPRATYPTAAVAGLSSHRAARNESEAGRVSEAHGCGGSLEDPGRRLSCHLLG
jgi:hypothetical protein